jgi:hypothetical protein
MTSAQASESRGGKNPDIAGGFVMSPARSQVAGAATPNFTDNGGLVLQNVHVRLIFWGSAWGTSGNHPTISDVANAVSSILSGPYMHSLGQYRGIGNGVLNGKTPVTTPVANSPANPPNPFSENDVQDLISNLINSGSMPDPASNSQLLYYVIMPPGVNYTKRHTIGLHSFLELGGQSVHYAWINNGGTLASVTRIFSHELVESCTDPEGSAILGTTGTCRGGGWCEIGDVCENQVKVVDGITVQSYWSQQDGRCVVPT